MVNINLVVEQGRATVNLTRIMWIMPRIMSGHHKIGYNIFFNVCPCNFFLSYKKIPYINRVKWFVPSCHLLLIKELTIIWLEFCVRKTLYIGGGHCLGLLTLNLLLTLKYRSKFLKNILYPHQVTFCFADSEVRTMTTCVLKLDHLVWKTRKTPQKKTCKKTKQNVNSK